MNIQVRSKSWKAIVLGFVAVTLGGFHSTAWSEDVAPPASSDLEQRIRILERKLEVSDEATATKSKESAKVTAGKEGFQIKSADGDFLLKIRALIQADSRFFINSTNNSEVDQFLIRRARPILEGTIYQYANFLFVPDFANNGKNVLVDAYLDIAPWSFIKLRAGKFKSPIGLEHLQSDPNLIFAERGFPSLLVPSRETGVQLFGDFWQGALNYAISATNGVGDNNLNTNTTTPVTSDGDVNDSKEGTARLYAQPFKNTELELLQKFGVGFGASYSAQSTTNPTYTTPGQLSLFSVATTALADGEKIRLAPELNWYYHALGIFGEYVQSSQVFRVGRVRSTIVNDAWQVAASYVITGEDASYSGVKPRKPFDPKNGTWGAFEVAGRFHELYLDPDNFTKGVTTAAASVQRATAIGGGINWYLTSALRFTTDYEHTTFDKGATIGDRPNEDVVISRWQIYF